MIGGTRPEAFPKNFKLLDIISKKKPKSKQTELAKASEAVRHRQHIKFWVWFSQSL